MTLGFPPPSTSEGAVFTQGAFSSPSPGVQPPLPAPNLTGSTTGACAGPPVHTMTPAHTGLLVSPLTRAPTPFCTIGPPGHSLIVWSHPARPKHRTASPARAGPLQSRRPRLARGGTDGSVPKPTRDSNTPPALAASRPWCTGRHREHQQSTCHVEPGALAANESTSSPHACRLLEHLPQAEAEPARALDSTTPAGTCCRLEHWQPSFFTPSARRRCT